MESFFLWDPSALEVVINKWQRRFYEHGFWTIFKQRSDRINYALLHNVYHLRFDHDDVPVDFITMQELKRAFISISMSMLDEMIVFAIELIYDKCSKLYR